MRVRMGWESHTYCKGKRRALNPTKLTSLDRLLPSPAKLAESFSRVLLASDPMAACWLVMAVVTVWISARDLSSAA